MHAHKLRQGNQAMVDGPTNSKRAHEKNNQPVHIQKIITGLRDNDTSQMEPNTS